MADPSQTLNIPSLLLVVALLFLTIRYFFFSSSSASSYSPSSSSASNRSGQRTIDPAQIAQIAQMFPQVGRREIQWDLQRNGGSVVATTERIMQRGGLDIPPPSFQPIVPEETAPETAVAPTKSQHPDLITRYNLGSRIGTDAGGGGDSTREGKGKGVAGREGPVQWSQNKSERQALLQRRREEMVLGARRKMEERERGGSTGRGL